MPALVIQTIEQSPRVLVICDYLNNATNLQKILRSQGLEVVTVNSQGVAALLSSESDWYKIFWLVSDASKITPTNQQLILDIAEQLQQWESVLTVCIPLSTAVVDQEEPYRQWQSATHKQVVAYAGIQEKIDISRFIYYFNLAENTQYPLAFFFQDLEKQHILDPGIQLGLLSAESLFGVLEQQLLRQRTHPLVIVPTAKTSQDIAEHIRELYFHYHQIELKIKTVSTQQVFHPLLEYIQAEIEEIEVPDRIFEVVRPLVRQLPLVSETLSDDESLVRPSLLSHLVTQPESTRTTRRGVVPKKMTANYATSQAVFEEVVPEVVSDMEATLSTSPFALTISSLEKKVEQQSEVIKKLLQNAVRTKTKIAEVVQPSSPTLSRSQNEILENIVKPEFDPIERINAAFERPRFSQRQNHLSTLLKVSSTAWKKNKRRRASFIFGALITVFGVGLLGLTVLTTFSVGSMRDKILSYAEVNAHTQEEQQQIQDKLLEQYHSPIMTQYQNLVAPLIHPLFPDLRDTLEIVALFDQLTKEKTAFESSVVSGYAIATGQEDGDSIEQFSKAATQAEQLYKTLSVLEVQLAEFPDKSINYDKKRVLEQFTASLEQTRMSVARFQQLQPMFAPVLGAEGKRTYGVLFQNEQELRPSGGFIQAVALVTVENGVITDVVVDDIYSLDQKMVGVSEPPNEIRQFLGEKRWFLRDSNWDGDFPQAAKTISTFIKNSTGTQVDGLIALNVDTLAQILAVSGTLELPEYNEVITAKNIAERMEFHSEIQLNSADVKPDYSKVLFTRFIEHLRKLAPESRLTTLKTIEQQFQDKNAYISLISLGEQGTLESLGWTGSLVQPACPTALVGSSVKSTCLVDSIAQVEANIGVNRANYYLQRQIDHSIKLTPSAAEHTRVIKFTNTASSNAWPKGAYRTFTRFYLPKDTQLSQVMIDEKQVELSSLFHTTQGNFTVYGVVTETPIGKSTKLQLQYAVPHTHGTPFAYAFFDQKQAGARDVSPRVFMEFAPNLQPTLIAPQAEVQGNVIVFNPTQNSGHTFVGALFE